MFGLLISKFLPSGITQYIIEGILALAIIGMAVFYFYYSQNKISELNQKVEAANLAVAQQTTTINDLNTNIDNINKFMNNYNSKMAQLDADNQKLKNDFKNLNIQQVAKSNPKQAELIVNKSVDDALSRIEQSTASQEIK